MTGKWTGYEFGGKRGKQDLVVRLGVTSLSSSVWMFRFGFFFFFYFFFICFSPIFSDFMLN
jgi:hypothetical protein